MTSSSRTSRTRHHRRPARSSLRTAGRALNATRLRRPWTLALGSLLWIPGVLALVYGDEVSQALSNIAADTVSRTVGLALLAGSIVTLVGLFRARHILEVIGLGLLAIGASIYGLGVLLGLGLKGSVAATGYLAIAIGSVLRISSLSVQARETPADES